MSVKVQCLRLFSLLLVVLGGSWVVLSRIFGRVTLAAIVTACIRRLKTPVLTAHEPPNTPPENPTV